MISYIQGQVMAVGKRHCTLLTSGGVGYRLALPAHTIGELPAAGENAALHTSLIVREDAMELYGFATPEERDTFVVLTGISRVGARTALAILSIFRPQELQDLVAREDARAFASVPGIGAKTSQHILLELKYKLKNIPSDTQRGASAAPSALADAMGALAGLGYAEEECGPLLRDLLKEEPDLAANELIRLALKKLGKGK